MGMDSKNLLSAPEETTLPKVSVVVPTYHRNDLLALCLDRLAPGVQTLPAELYEVIVTDDGKKTTAQEMIRTRYPWARWVEGPKRGSAANRNNGVRYVRADWIAFTDDDCLPEPQWLAAFHNAMQPGVFVYEGLTNSTRAYRYLVEQVPMNLYGNNLWSCNMMIARSVFTELGGFDETFPYAFQEDTDFRERIKEAGYAFPFVREACVYHPPRERVLGRKAGQWNEMLVLVWYKAGHREPLGFRLPLFLLKSRLKEIVTSFRLPDALIALNGAILEVLYVLRNIKAWERKYREKYAGLPPAYPTFSVIPTAK